MQLLLKTCFDLESKFLCKAVSPHLRQGTTRTPNALRTKFNNKSPDDLTREDVSEIAS